jgi:hypothetical protein
MHGNLIRERFLTYIPRFTALSDRITDAFQETLALHGGTFTLASGLLTLTHSPDAFHGMFGISAEW